MSMRRELYVPERRLNVLGRRLGVRLFGGMSRGLTAILVLSLVAMSSFGQGAFTGIKGTVTDKTGSSVANANVTIRQSETGAVRSLTTDNGGRYAATGLAVGTYEIKVASPGFATVTQQGLHLNVGDNPEIDFSLSLATVSQEVEVAGTAPIVETTTATIASLVNELETRALPLNGRGFAQLIAIQPGVQSISGGAGVQNVSGGGLIMAGSATAIFTAGQRPENNLYLIDSSELNTLARSTPFSGGGDMLGVEAIQEFKVLSQYDASYGKVAGGVMTAVSRSGANSLHGSGFYFRRDSAFDARNYFDGPEVPPFYRNQFGGTLGGPIVHDKTFFFGSFEGLREHLQSTRIAYVPDENAHKGIVPGIAPFTVAPGVVPFLNLYPLPNGPNFGNGIGQYSFIGAFPRSQNQFMGRIDHRLSTRTSFFGRYMYTDGSTDAPLEVPAFHMATENRYQYLTLGSTQTLSPRMVNQLLVSANRTRFQLMPGPTFAPDQSFFAVPGRNIVPQVQIASVSSAQGASVSFLGPGAIPRGSFIQNVISSRDDLSVSIGAHTLSFGGDVGNYQANTLLATMEGGLYIFPSLAGFLKGTPAAALVVANTPDNNPSASGTQKYVSSYVQDAFKATRHLTLNFGLRYEFLTGPSERHGRISSMDFSQPTAPPILGRMWGNTHTFAPRAGLAWDPTGSGKTAIRAGGGIYYNQLLPSTWAFFASAARFPWWSPRTIPAPAFFPAVPDSVLQQSSPGTMAAYLFDSNLKVQTSAQYNVSVQREIVPDLGVTISYVGAITSHGIEGTKGNVTQPVSFTSTGQPTYCAAPPVCPFRPRINPNVGEVNALRSDSNSNYNSLQVSVNKRMGHGVEFSAGYTYAKALADFDMLGAEVITQPPVAMNPYDRHQEYAPARFDVRNKVTVRGLWDVPFGKEHAYGGWQVSGIFSAHSGTPLTAMLGSANSKDGQSFNVAERPNLAPGTVIPMPRTAAKWFDPSVFTFPTAGTYGNSARSSIEGPGYSGLDMALSKAFKLTERHVLNLRWDVFNVLNHTNFGAPNTVVFDATGQLSPTAARITQTAGTSRQMQLSVKYQF